MRGGRREAPAGAVHSNFTSPPCGEGGAKRRGGAVHLQFPLPAMRGGRREAPGGAVHSNFTSPPCGEVGAKRRVGRFTPISPPRHAGRSARSAEWGGSLQFHLPAMRGGRREAPGGAVHS